MYHEHAKALVALIMAILTILDLWFGVNLPVTQPIVTTVIAVLTPILVWAVPNRPAAAAK